MKTKIKALLWTAAGVFVGIVLHLHVRNFAINNDMAGLQTVLGDN